MVGTGGTQLEKGVQGKAVHVSVGDVWLVQGDSAGEGCSG